MKPDNSEPGSLKKKNNKQRGNFKPETHVLLWFVLKMTQKKIKNSKKNCTSKIVNTHFTMRLADARECSV